MLFLKKKQTFSESCYLYSDRDILGLSPQEQYEFCYKVVQEYIDAFSDYANFK